MKFNTRQLIEEDYPLLSEWWTFYNFPPPNKDFLPDNGTSGVMVEDEDGKPLCAGFLYETNSLTCLLEFVIANPESKGEQRHESLLLLIETLTDLAEEWGYKYIFATVGHEKLIDKYLETGFQKGDVGTTELIKTI